MLLERRTAAAVHPLPQDLGALAGLAGGAPARLAAVLVSAAADGAVERGVRKLLRALKAGGRRGSAVITRLSRPRLGLLYNGSCCE